MLTALITSAIEQYLTDVERAKELDIYSGSIVDSDYSLEPFKPCYKVRFYATKEFYAAANSANAMAIRHQTVLGGSLAHEGRQMKTHQLQLISSGGDCNQTTSNRDFAIAAIEQGLKDGKLCFFGMAWCDYFKSMLSASSYDEQNNCWIASAILLIRLSKNSE